MAPTNDEANNLDSQILARLRRRSVAEPTARDENAAADNDARDQRVDVLKRLVGSNAPKATMSSLSPTLRDLRRELDDEEIGDEDSNLATPPDVPVVADDRDEERADRSDANASSERAPREQESRRARESFGDAMLVVSNLTKSYWMGKNRIPVLRGIDLSLRKGEFLAIVGQSGSGKSTLLHLMGTLDVPDGGAIHFEGQRIDNLPINQRDVLRNRYIGMIFQFYHLLPELTTLENVLAPIMIRYSFWEYMRNRSEYVARAKDLLALVGLSHRLKHRPNELSGGEMQRASIARALITNPRMLLADEPTGNLDSKASIGVLELLRRLNREQGLTVAMVTHDPSQARDADRFIRLVDGRVAEES